MVVLLSVDRLHVGDCPPKFAIISLRIDVPMYSCRFPGFVNVWSFLQICASASFTIAGSIGRLLQKLTSKLNVNSGNDFFNLS